MNFSYFFHLNDPGLLLDMMHFDKEAGLDLVDDIIEDIEDIEDIIETQGWVF